MDAAPSKIRGIVRHAVFPVAGLGAELLPATKACPKEMLPIVDRPMIQYAVEEAAAAGLTRMIFITGRGKRAIEDHFDRAYELERELAIRGDNAALDKLRATVPAGISFSYIRQREPSGVLGALRMARSLLGDTPFAVVLPDQLFDGGRPALAQLLDVFSEHGCCVVGAERAHPGTHDESPVIGAGLDTSAIASARALVHVPPIGAAFESLAAAGRFVFTPSAWSAFDRAADTGLAGPPLVAAIRKLMERERVFACVIEGRRHDCGTRLGYLEAQIAFAKKRPELWTTVQRQLEHSPSQKPRVREPTPVVVPDPSSAPPAFDASLSDIEPSINLQENLTASSAGHPLQATD
jgi:UTP--glucose-1-phosphate uridylyltransferase